MSPPDSFQRQDRWIVDKHARAFDDGQRYQRNYSVEHRPPKYAITLVINHLPLERYRPLDDWVPVRGYNRNHDIPQQHNGDRHRWRGTEDERPPFINHCQKAQNECIVVPDMLKVAHRPKRYHTIFVPAEARPALVLVRKREEERNVGKVFDEFGSLLLSMAGNIQRLGNQTALANSQASLPEVEVLEETHSGSHQNDGVTLEDGIEEVVEETRSGEPQRETLPEMNPVTVSSANNMTDDIKQLRQALIAPLPERPKSRLNTGMILKVPFEREEAEEGNVVLGPSTTYRRRAATMAFHLPSYIPDTSVADTDSEETASVLSEAPLESGSLVNFRHRLNSLLRRDYSTQSSIYSIETKPVRRNTISFSDSVR